LPKSNINRKRFEQSFIDDEEEDEKQENNIDKESTMSNGDGRTQTFFFFDIDSRLKEGLESFVRTDDLNELEKNWPAKRKEIAEALRTKHRKAIQWKTKRRIMNYRRLRRLPTQLSSHMNSSNKNNPDDND